MNLATMLTVLFVALKLLGVIAWPWWVVLIPFWGPIAFVMIIFALAAMKEVLS